MVSGVVFAWRSAGIFEQFRKNVLPKIFQHDFRIYLGPLNTKIEHKNVFIEAFLKLIFQFFFFSFFFSISQVLHD